MIFSAQQLQLSSKTETRRQLCTQLSRNICISWSLNLVLAVTAIVLLLVASLDAAQAAFCAHLVFFCTTCAVMVWTKDSRNALLSISLVPSIAHFLMRLFIIWDCEPLFFVLKLAHISCFWLSTQIMHITSARLVFALEQKSQSRVRVTIVQLLIGALLVLVASLHLAYPEQEAFSYAEMALWGCFLGDILRHFDSWKMTMRRVFRGVKGTSKTLSRRNSSLKRRQNIMISAGPLFAGTVGCAFMISANPVLDLLLQYKSNQCQQRNSVGSHRISAFAFPCFLAIQISYWVNIYSHVKKRRDQKLQDTKEDRQFSPVSLLVTS